MTETFDGPPQLRRRRSDGQRSIDAIVSAAADLLSRRSDTSMEEIAVSAGVTRQTVYAHFASRELLIGAVLEKEKAECLMALSGGRLDCVPPVEALALFLEITWRLYERCPFLHDPTLFRIPGRQGGGASRQAVMELLEDMVRRGQGAGDFDPGLPAAWLAEATLGLGHTTAAQVAAGNLSADEALATLMCSTFRLYGIDNG
jgi:AcrR family transcriptional regulator